MTSIIEDLAGLADEPIISDENENTLRTITGIVKTSAFELLELDETKLDELIQGLKDSEEFSKEIPSITEGLEIVPSIVLADEDEEEEYI